MALIEIEGAEKRYGTAVALDDVSLRVGTGECVALVGESGSGKTTLLRAINRLTALDRGRVVVRGEPVDTLDPVALRRSIGYVQQDGGLIDVAAVRRANERVEVEGAAIADTARELLGVVGLTDPSRGPQGEVDNPRGSLLRPGDASMLLALPVHMWENRTELARQVARHLLLVLLSLGAAIFAVLPAGVALERRRSLAEGAIRLAGLLQTIPGIALLAFMIPVFGIGVAPAVMALYLYSLLPILRNSYTGIIEAARGGWRRGGGRVARNARFARTVFHRITL